MYKFLPTYLTTMLVMVVLDIIWLSVVAKPIYQQGIGHLMASQPNLVFAVLFYMVFVLGIMWLAILPNLKVSGFKTTFTQAAIFGFFVYASYDLTNLALLRNWPLSLSIIDITWGTFVTGVSALAGKYVLKRLTGI